MTRICIPIFVRSGGAEVEEAIDQAEEVLAEVEGEEGGMIELRADTATPRQLLQALDLVHVPVIVTIRPNWEGGLSQKTDQDRLTMWESAMDAGADHIDVELVSWEKSGKIRETLTDLAEKNGVRLIVSNHCFTGRPNLADRMGRLRRVKEASILKLAWRAESVLDAVDALKLSAENREKKIDGRPMVALAMGEEGLVSRLLAKRFGAPFTFASAETGKESAPGQPTAEALLGIYRWNSEAAQKASSPLFAVAGWPIGHSLSPHVHNAGFEAVGTDGVYVPLAIKPEYEAFKAAVDAFRGLGLRGLSVTIPHKENAIRYVREHGGAIDETSARIGVINTILFPAADAGPIKGFNSDYAGALDALVTVWSGAREDVRGKRVAILGAGGAARAIIAGLAGHGASVTLFNRTLEKAEALAREFAGVTAKPFSELASERFDAYINCTPLGMHPNTGTSPIDNAGEVPLGEGIVVFDTVYNPRMTKLLKQASAKGAKIVTGDEMFVRQAALQFKEFTGREAPLEVFRNVMQEALAGK